MKRFPRLRKAYYDPGNFVGRSIKRSGKRFHVVKSLVPREYWACKTGLLFVFFVCVIRSNTPQCHPN